MQRHHADCCTSFLVNKSRWRDKRGHIVAKCFQDWVDFAHAVAFGWKEEWTACILLMSSHIQLQGLSWRTRGKCAKIARQCSWSYESSPVVEEIYMEAIDAALGVVVIANRHWTQSWLLLVKLGIKLVVGTLGRLRHFLVLLMLSGLKKFPKSDKACRE